MNHQLEPGNRLQPRGARLMLGWGVVAFLALASFSLSQRRPAFWDETVYLGRAIALSHATTFTGWLVDNDTAPTGPVHALLHFAASGGHGALPVPWVRLPNLILLLATGLVLAQSLRSMRLPGVTSAGLLCVPMIWVVAGLAITEPPAMFGFSLALLGAVRLAFRSDDDPAEISSLVMLAVGVAVATCGRQNYLLTVPAFGVIALRRRSDLLPLAVALFCGLLPFFALIALWKGLVPPKLAFVGGGVKLQHAVLAFTITGVTTVIIAPRFFSEKWRVALPLSFCAAIANAATGFVHFTTLTSVQKMFGSPGWAALLERAFNGVGVLVGTWFTVALLGHASRANQTVRGAILAILALNVGCAAVVHQFSSRYPAMAMPALILVLSPFVRFGPFTLLRWTAGAAVGLAVLRSYFLFAP